jgi:hypothetical protein
VKENFLLLSRPRFSFAVTEERIKGLFHCLSNKTSFIKKIYLTSVLLRNLVKIKLYQKQVR